VIGGCKQKVNSSIIFQIFEERGLLLKFGSKYLFLLASYEIWGKHFGFVSEEKKKIDRGFSRFMTFYT
jgi:hypothetical protein